MVTTAYRMERSSYRRLALAVWGPLVAAHAVAGLQVLSGSESPLFDRLVAVVGEGPLALALALAFLVGGVALANSDIGESRV